VAVGVGQGAEAVAPEHVLGRRVGGRAGVDRLFEDGIDVLDVREDADARGADLLRRLLDRLRGRPASITTESPISSSAWAMIPSGALPAETLVVAIDPGKVVNRVWLASGECALIGEPSSLPSLREGVEQLLREAGLEGRAEWRLHDVAAHPDGIEPADIVVLHRVVCWYPDEVSAARSLTTRLSGK
jgi:hypothetical protein